MEEVGREIAVASMSEVGGGGGGSGGRSKDTPSPTPSPPLSPPAVATGGGGMGLMGVPQTMGVTGMIMPSMVTMMSGGSTENLARKKHGRPQKYLPDGVAGGVSLTLSPGSSTQPTPFSLTTKSSGDLSAKRGRGRPPGSGRRQLLAALGDWFAYSAGGNFTPHVVTIATGEDVATRILSFSQKGPRSICILSANGAISNVTLRQPGSSGGTLTFEGRFEILSLSGSFTITENGGVRSRTGGISVSLAGPDGRVVGGGVAGLLLAASPIQVVVGSFLPNTLREHKRKSNLESSGLSTIPPFGSGVLTAARPIFQAIHDDDCETSTSGLPGQSQGEAEKGMGNTPNPNSAPLRTVVWPGLQSSSEHKPSPDINIRLHGEL